MTHKRRPPTEGDKFIQSLKDDPVCNFVGKTCLYTYMTIFSAVLVLWVLIVFVFVPVKLVNEGYKAVTGNPGLKVLK